MKETGNRLTSEPCKTRRRRRRNDEMSRFLSWDSTNFNHGRYEKILARRFFFSRDEKSASVRPSVYESVVLFRFGLLGTTYARLSGLSVNPVYKEYWK